MQPLAQHGSGQCRREEHAVAGNEPTRFCQLAMDCNKVHRCKAIAVEKDTIVAAGSEPGPVAALGGTKPALRLPHMAERHAEPGPPTLYQRGGRGAGTVVRDHDFEASVILTRQCRQRRIERILAIICREDDGDEIRQVAAPEFHSACLAAL